jgi:hypothetical protein
MHRAGLWGNLDIEHEDEVFAGAALAQIEDEADIVEVLGREPNGLILGYRYPRAVHPAGRGDRAAAPLTRTGAGYAHPRRGEPRRGHDRDQGCLPRRRVARRRTGRPLRRCGDRGRRGRQASPAARPPLRRGYRRAGFALWLSWRAELDGLAQLDAGILVVLATTSPAWIVAINAAVWRVAAQGDRATRDQRP